MWQLIPAIRLWSGLSLVTGAGSIQTELVVRFGYGSVVPWVHRQKDGTLRAIAGPDQLVLRTPVPIRGEGMKTVGEFTVAAGEAIPFTLTYAPSNLPPPDPTDPLAALERTEAFWREWSGRARIEEDERRAAVIRSLITLKALTHAPTGGIVAAPTTSLPEHSVAYAIGITVFAGCATPRYHCSR